MLHFMVDCTFMHLALSPVPSRGGGAWERGYHDFACYGGYQVYHDHSTNVDWIKQDEVLCVRMEVHATHCQLCINHIDHQVMQQPGYITTPGHHSSYRRPLLPFWPGLQRC